MLIADTALLPASVDAGTLTPLESTVLLEMHLP
jgi:hypothetical protein